MKKRFLSLILVFASLIIITANTASVYASGEKNIVGIKYYTSYENDVLSNEVTSVKNGDYVYAAVTFENFSKVWSAQITVGFDTEKLELTSFTTNEAIELPSEMFKISENNAHKDGTYGVKQLTPKIGNYTFNPAVAIAYPTVLKQNNIGMVSCAWTGNRVAQQRGTDIELENFIILKFKVKSIDDARLFIPRKGNENDIYLAGNPTGLKLGSENGIIEYDECIINMPPITKEEKQENIVGIKYYTSYENDVLSNEVTSINKGDTVYAALTFENFSQINIATVSIGFDTEMFDLISFTTGEKVEIPETRTPFYSICNGFDGAFDAVLNGTYGAKQVETEITYGDYDGYTFMATVSTVTPGMIRCGNTGIFVFVWYDATLDIIKEEVMAVLKLKAKKAGQAEFSIPRKVQEGDPHYPNNIDGISVSLDSLEKNYDDCTINMPPLTITGAQENKASVGDVGYPTLEEAVDVAKEGDIVKILSDVALSEALEITKNIILDLNGKTIKFDTEKWINSNDNNYLITVSGNGKLTVADCSDEQTGKIDGAMDNNFASVGIKLVNGTAAGKTALAVNSGTVVGNSNAVYSDKNGNGADIIINGGKLVSLNTDGGVAIHHSQKGDLVIRRGVIEGHIAVYFSNGKLNISGGNLTSVEEPLIIENCYDSTLECGNTAADISGGKFVSERAKSIGSYLSEQDGSTGGKALSGFVSGGSFSAIGEGLTGKGYEIRKNTNGLYDVVFVEKWVVTTDAGAYDNGRKGMIRYLFAFDIDESRIEKSEIRYIKENDIRSKVYGTVSGKSAAFYGDITGIDPSTDRNATYYAFGYVKTINGNEYFSEPIGCKPNFTKIFKNYKEGNE